MAQGFRVRFRSNEPSIQGERVVFQLPIRIGRNSLNNLQIPHQFVSDLHAVIESADGQLWLRDLNSTNGSYAISGERFPPNVRIPLAPLNNTFILGRIFHVNIEVFEQDRPVGERLSGMTGSVVGNREMLRVSARPLPPYPAGPAAGPGYGVPPMQPASDGNSFARPAYVPTAQPSPWGGPGGGHSQGPGSLPMLAPLPAGPGSPPPGQQRAAAPPAAQRDPRATQHFAMGAETMALLGLQELAGSLVPGVPLQTTGDIARLITKLHDTLEVFCRCFVPMREGYAQFVSQMDLRREKSQRSFNRSSSAMQVEVAHDPAAVASALLDWRNQDYDAPGVVEGIFADLMTHQLALVEGVMRGVQALREELSPDRIEQLLKEQPAGASAMLGRYRALWKTFETHYEELKNETRTFEVVFGSDFASSYREYLSRRDRTIP